MSLGRVKGSCLDVLWYVEMTRRVSLALLVPTHNLFTLTRSICFSLWDQVGCRVQGVKGSSKGPRVQGQVGVILYKLFYTTKTSLALMCDSRRSTRSACAEGLGFPPRSFAIERPPSKSNQFMHSLIESWRILCQSGNLFIYVKGTGDAGCSSHSSVGSCRVDLHAFWVRRPWIMLRRPHVECRVTSCH
jgi:hypothetical protein